MQAMQRESDTETIVFGVTGMTCAGCANQAEKALKTLPGLDAGAGEQS